MMSSSDHDEDLKLAMAMSLQQSPSTAPAVSSTNSDAIDLTSDTEDEDGDLQRAIALSLGETEDAVGAEHPSAESSHPSTHATTISTKSGQSAKPPSDVTLSPMSTISGPLSFAGLDRRAMEQERLARLGKRKRDPSPEQPSKQIARTLITATPQNSTTSLGASRDGTIQYPRGAIKRTFATKYARTNDITIDELLEASSVNIAVISSFMWDAEWLHEKLDPTKVKQIWLMNVKGQDVQERYVRDLNDSGIPNLKVHFPPIGGMIHSMHSKFMLLFGKNKLRVVVPTANMMRTDWGETGNDWQPAVMENSVFLIDLPRRADGEVGDKDELTRFGQELVYFLEQQKVGRNVVDGMLKFDFSQTAHLAFIHSIGGAHRTESDHATGLPGLAQAIQDLQLDGVEAIELDYAASSLGAINDTLLQRIYLAACGKPFTTDNIISDVRDHIRIYFPTHDTVEKSTGGPNCGGIISLTRQYYNAPTFPKDCLRDYDSTRRGMLSHNKLLFARGRKKDGKPFAWVYIGSANISESAWGGQKVLKSGKLGSLNIRNWECGVVMPVSNDRFAGLNQGEIPPMSVFEGTVEVPFKYPGERYQGKQPWFFRPG